MIDKEKVIKVLESVIEPKLKKNLVELGLVKEISIASDAINLVLAIPSLNYPLKDRIVNEITTKLNKISENLSLNIKFTLLSPEDRARLFPKPSLKGIENVKHFLAVASGKGGVGKTSIAVNTALALSKTGYKVGLLDADVYGPSIPMMLGLTEKATHKDGMLIPVEKYGIKIISFGMLMEKGEAVIWRGPLVSRTIT